MSKTSYQREYRKNMTDEQKQKHRECEKRYKENMTDEQKKTKRLLKRTQKKHNR